MIRSLLGLLLLAAEGVACASSPIPPHPPYAGAYQPQGVDERGLWMLVDEEERQLRDSKFVIRDQQLLAYVNRVLCQTVGKDRCSGVRVYLVRDTDFNAAMMPNGAMMIHSGLLFRLRTEAELGAVLAHEFAHFELRHSLRGFQNKRNGTDVMAWASFVTGGAQIQQAMLGSIFVYTREQEKEADLKSAEYLAASSYRAASAADIWSRLLDESDASAKARKQRSQRHRRAGFLDTHPTSLDRMQYLKGAAARSPGGDKENARDYRTAIAPWWSRFVDDQINLNDFGAADYLLNQQAVDGWTPELLFARGELYRQRAQPRDLVAAATFYREAIDKGASQPEVWRGLGLALIRSNVIPEGRQALEQYLSVKPDASDAAIVRAIWETSK